MSKRLPLSPLTDSFCWCRDTLDGLCYRIQTLSYARPAIQRVRSLLSRPPRLHQSARMIPTPITSHLSAEDFETVYEPAGALAIPSLQSITRLSHFASQRTPSSSSTPSNRTLHGSGAAESVSRLGEHVRRASEVWMATDRSRPPAGPAQAASPPSSAQSAGLHPLVSPSNDAPLAPAAPAEREISRCTVYLTTDLNPHACRCTLLTSSRNAVPLDPVLTDLTAALLPRLSRQVDVLVFNPPYVETEDEEAVEAQGQEDKRIEKSWAGGAGGMRVTSRLLEQVDVRAIPRLTCLCGELELTSQSGSLQTLLSDRGLFYLVAVPENKPLAIIAAMQARRLEGEVRLSLETVLAFPQRWAPERS